MAGRALQLPASPEEGVDLAPLMQCLCTVRTHMDTRTQWLLWKSMATKACRQRKTWALSSKITTHKDFSNPSRTFWQKSCQDSTLVPFLSIHLACSITSAFAAS